MSAWRLATALGVVARAAGRASPGGSRPIDDGRLVRLASRPARIEVVYAVTGDAGILRFTADLHPDERIELGR